MSALMIFAAAKIISSFVCCDFFFISNIIRSAIFRKQITFSRPGRKVDMVFICILQFVLEIFYLFAEARHFLVKLLQSTSSQSVPFSSQLQTFLYASIIDVFTGLSLQG